MDDFDKWWHETGSGISPLSFHDHEEHAERVARAAWEFVRNQLCKERDEARQLACEFCVMDGSGYSSSYRAKEEAIARGWDCYKEKNDNA
jgi:hypothetical protein